MEQTTTCIIFLAELLFWAASLAVLHSYVFYPFIIQLLAKRKKKNITSVEYSDNELPFLSIIIPAHNEIAVIDEKLNTVLNNNYPKDKFEILIGSDCSTDGTNEMIHNKAKTFTNIRPYIFNSRQGKPAMLNQLVPQANGEIVVFSDANILFSENTLRELVKRFSDNRIGLVDTRMMNLGMTNKGISQAENTYISREVRIKQAESEAFGTMMGPFGGCFAMRRKLFEPIPPTFTVDDFFLNMIVFEKGYQCVSSAEAIVYENVSDDIQIEYRRKVRISSGNYQNLKRFKKLLWPLTSPVAFCWLSHKVLRWFSPQFYLIALLSSLIVTSLTGSFVYGSISVLFIAGALLPFFDNLLHKIGVNIVILRLINHFAYMNLALLHGFIKYLKGIKTNVWEPTKRD
jgi:cellulose synthase/poly-beta-1,6-N-acetylglucosamine synthase-like glycosyltransferase